jgi:hypothetical protein
VAQRRSRRHDDQWRNRNRGPPIVSAAAQGDTFCELIHGRRRVPGKIVISTDNGCERLHPDEQDTSTRGAVR